MGVDKTDSKLMQICTESFDLKKLIHDVKLIEQQYPTIFLGVERFNVIFPGVLKELLESENAYLVNKVPGFSKKQIDITNIQDKVAIVFLGITIGGFVRSKYYSVYQKLEDKIAVYLQPVQDHFAKKAYEETPKLINEFFEKNREIKTSFVILTGLNNKASLGKMLKSFRTFTPPSKDLEVIVVVNGSTDDSMLKAIKTLGKDYQLKLINCPENLGIAGGYNQGFGMAAGKYICVLQDDVLFSQKNWHRELEYYLDHHSNIGVLGGYRGECSFKYVYDQSIFHDQLIVPYDAIGPKLIGPTDWEILKEFVVQVDAVNCMAVLFRKELGKYDENYLPYGIEDLAFCFEARKKGYDVYVTDVGISHGSLKSASRKKTLITPKKSLMSRRLSRAYHYQYFAANYSEMLRDPVSDKSLKNIENLVAKFPKIKM